MKDKRGKRSKIHDPFDSADSITPPPATAHRTKYLDPAEGESSSITDSPSMYKKMEKFERYFLRMAGPIAQIPTIAERVSMVEEKLESNRDKVHELSGKVVEGISKAHDCHQVDTIDELKNGQRISNQKLDEEILESTRDRERLTAVSLGVESVGEGIERAHMDRRANQKAMVGVAVTLLLAAASAVYFFGGLSARVDSGQVRDREATQRLEKSMHELTRKVSSSQRPVIDRVDRVFKRVKANEGHEEAYNQLCEGMNNREKRIFRNTLSRRDKRIPRSCVVE